MLLTNIAKLALSALAVVGVVIGHASGASVKEKTGRGLDRVGFGHTHVTGASIKQLAARHDGEDHGHVVYTTLEDIIINTICVTTTQTVKRATSEVTLHETPTTHIEPTSTEVKHTIPPTDIEVITITPSTTKTPEYIQTPGNLTTTGTKTSYSTAKESTPSSDTIPATTTTTTTPTFIQNPTPSQGAGYKVAGDTLLVGLGIAVLIHAAY